MCKLHELDTMSSYELYVYIARNVMAESWFIILIEVSLIIHAMIAGLFLTFSDFLMRSLGKAVPVSGIEVMQHINREIFRSVTILLLWGMVCVSLAISLYAFINLAGTSMYLLMLGGLIYVIGVLCISNRFNIPMNDKLEGMQCASNKAATYWQETYLPRWTFWNYFRAFASCTSAVCYLTAIHGLGSLS